MSELLQRIQFCHWGVGLLVILFAWLCWSDLGDPYYRHERRMCLYLALLAYWLVFLGWCLWRLDQ